MEEKLPTDEKVSILVEAVNKSGEVVPAGVPITVFAEAQTDTVGVVTDESGLKWITPVSAGPFTVHVIASANFGSGDVSVEAFLSGEVTVDVVPVALKVSFGTQVKL